MMEHLTSRHLFSHRSLLSTSRWIPMWEIFVFDSIIFVLKLVFFQIASLVPGNGNSTETATTQRATATAKMTLTTQWSTYISLSKTKIDLLIDMSNLSNNSDNIVADKHYTSYKSYILRMYYCRSSSNCSLCQYEQRDNSKCFVSTVLPCTVNLWY